MYFSGHDFMFARSNNVPNSKTHQNANKHVPTRNLAFRDAVNERSRKTVAPNATEPVCFEKAQECRALHAPADEKISLAVEI